MKSVEFFDWKLNKEKPFSYLVKSYPSGMRRILPDMHSALHLGLILHGERTGVYTGEMLRSRTGEYYLTAPWEPHYTLSVSSNHKLLLFNIDLESLQNTFFTGKNLLETLLLLPPGKRMLLLNKKLQNTGLEKELLDTLKMQEGTQKELLLWNHIQKIFITILPGQQQNKDLSFDYQRLLPALQNLSNTLLDTGKAAALCHLSPGYFSVLFKKKFGMSFGKCERNFRLNGAEGDIRKGCSLKEAASFWDFCDKSHLARLLKKRK